MDSKPSYTKQTRLFLQSHEQESVRSLDNGIWSQEAILAFRLSNMRELLYRHDQDATGCGLSDECRADYQEIYCNLPIMEHRCWYTFDFEFGGYAVCVCGWSSDFSLDREKLFREVLRHERESDYDTLP